MNFRLMTAYVLFIFITVALPSCSKDDSIVSSPGFATTNLYQNYPNPFSQVTGIYFETGKRQFLSLRIFDAQEREVAILVNDTLQPGRYRAEWDASNFEAGLYSYKLIAVDFTDTKKMLLIK